MSTTTELDPFAAAVAAAQGEGEAEVSPEPLEEPTQLIESEPEAEDDDALSDGDEHADEVTAEEPEVLEDSEEPEPEAEAEGEEELFGDLELEDAPTTPQVTEEMVREFLGIDESVDLEEIKGGGLRLADYTRKTQEVAALRKDAETAIGFWEKFQSDPQGVVVALATRAGLISEGDVKPADIDLPFYTEEEIEGIVQERLKAQLQEHPDIVAAQQAAADQWIVDEFARIESEYEVTLGPESRRKVLMAAHQRGISDLELVFKALLADKQRKQDSSKRALKAASPVRPTGTAKAETNSEEASSFEEAYEMARADLSSRRKNNR